MSLFSRLFGGASDGAPEAQHEPEHYKGFDIHPEPVPDGSNWRIGARIQKEVDGALRTHQMVRADTLSDRDTAAAQSVIKAKRLIDEQGEGLFGRGP